MSLSRGKQKKKCNLGLKLLPVYLPEEDLQVNRFVYILVATDFTALNVTTTILLHFHQTPCSTMAHKAFTFTLPKLLSVALLHTPHFMTAPPPYYSGPLPICPICHICDIANYLLLITNKFFHSIFLVASCRILKEVKSYEWHTSSMQKQPLFNGGFTNNIVSS